MNSIGRFIIVVGMVISISAMWRFTAIAAVTKTMGYRLSDRFCRNAGKYGRSMASSFTPLPAAGRV